MLEALQINLMSLIYASEELQNCEEFFLEAL